MTGQRSARGDPSIFARASKACYAVVFFVAIVFGCLVTINASGLRVVPLSLLPAFSLLSCVLLVTIAVFGFYMRKIGRAYDLRSLSIASILIIAASIMFVVLISPALTGVSLSFYEALPSLLASLAALAVFSTIALFLFSLLLFSKGIRGLKRMLYLQGLKVFRRAETVSWFLWIPYVLFGVILAPLVFSSSPATADLGNQLYWTAATAVIGIGGAVLLILFASTLGKLSDPDILARAADAAARAPPEPRLFRPPTQFRGLRELPKNVLESFQQIEPDRKFDFTILRVKYLVLKKADVFMLVPESGVYVAYFIKLFDQTPTTKKRFKAPLIFPIRKHFSYSIAGFPVAKVRGHFTLPVDAVSRTEGSEFKYVSGSGIMYLVPRRDLSKGMYSPRALFSTEDLSEGFDKTTILKIIEALSNESAN